MPDYTTPTQLPIRPLKRLNATVFSDARFPCSITLDSTEWIEVVRLLSAGSPALAMKISSQIGIKPE